MSQYVVAMLPYNIVCVFVIRAPTTKYRVTACKNNFKSFSKAKNAHTFTIFPNPHSPPILWSFITKFSTFCHSARLFPEWAAQIMSDVMYARSAYALCCVASPCCASRSRASRRLLARTRESCLRPAEMWMSPIIPILNIYSKVKHITILEKRTHEWTLTIGKV